MDSPRTPLDVELLAEAFEAVTGEDRDISVLWWPERLRDGGQGTQRDFAAAVAREYLRLQSTDPSLSPEVGESEGET